MGKHLARFLSQLNLLLRSCDIHPQATVGTGIFFPHPLGLVIGRRVCIGDNGTIYDNVMIGQGYASARSEPTNADYPSLGANVVVQ
jgi:serine O-acetyltransferase